MFSRRYENSPSTTSASIIMVARTGRLMERSLRNTSSALPARDRDRLARLESAHGSGDDRLTAAQAGADLDERSLLVGRADGDLAPGDAPAVDHEHVCLAARVTAHRARGAGHHGSGPLRTPSPVASLRRRWR